MADDCDVTGIITAFLLNTCRLPPRPSIAGVHAAAICCGIGAKRAQDDFFPLITGSVTEFYIEPMLQYIGDIDVMYHHDIELAIPQGHPPPTQLPAEFHNYVEVHEIIDSHLPGYVYLELRYLLTKHSDGKYEYVDSEEGLYLTTIDDIKERNSIHGPAMTCTHPHHMGLSVDCVPCVRCLSWPPQATDWPTRNRNYDWPDSTTLDHVVSNGCDVVHAAHRQCRQHTWMGKYQCRLSFSRAEIVLLNSWMPVQQIAYHILRVYVKTERLSESVDNSEPAIMSNYHIKTLMLWACELKPRRWWTENLNLVRICVVLLNTLSFWLADTLCPHYFVNNCNLLGTSLSDAAATSKLMSIDETYLSTWLMNNYIGRCAQLCPSYILRPFDDDASTSVQLLHAVSEIVRWRLNASLFDMWEAVEYAETDTTQMSSLSLTARSYVYWITEWTKMYKPFSVCLSAVAMLFVARKISRNGFNDQLMDIFTAIVEPNLSHCSGVTCWCKTELNTLELVELLQKSAVELLTTYRQLTARDFASVATIVTTDFEALYAYKHSAYRQCLQLSTQNVHTLRDAACIPRVPILPEFVLFLDDDIISLTALTLVVNPKCREYPNYTCVSQLTLSLYLMAQCQLKLHHSVTSLAQTLDYIKVARRRHPLKCTLDHLMLELIERIAIRTISLSYSLPLRYIAVT